MATTQRYVGAFTAFGIITQVSDRIYNAQAVVRAKDGSTAVYRLPLLIALGVKGKVTT
jgi:hypothetical protein